MHVDTYSQKLKVDEKFFEWTWSKMGVVSLITGLENRLYLKNEQMKETDFLHTGSNSGKLQKFLKMARAF